MFVFWGDLGMVGRSTVSGVSITDTNLIYDMQSSSYYNIMWSDLRTGILAQTIIMYTNKGAKLTF